MARTFPSDYNGGMGRSQRGFNPRRYARSQEVRLLAGFFLLLYVVGGGLIWHFYGGAGALLGMVCVTVVLLVLVALYAILTLIGRWAGE